jgi:four helix bundle protein
LKQSPIFTRTYDLLRWLIPATVKFPRQQRFVLASALQQTALCFQEQIVDAAYAAHPKTALQQADASLAKLRLHLRLSHDLGFLGDGQYRHVAAMVDEIGKLLGGWLKTV